MTTYIEVGHETGVVIKDYGEVAEVQTVTDLLRGDGESHYVKAPYQVLPQVDFGIEVNRHKGRQATTLVRVLDTPLQSTGNTFNVGDYVCFNGIWNAVIVDYLESPITKAYVYKVMAAKNITRAQYRGEDWANALLEKSTRERFLEEYERLVEEQNERILKVQN